MKKRRMAQGLSLLLLLFMLSGCSASQEPSVAESEIGGNTFTTSDETASEGAVEAGSEDPADLPGVTEVDPAIALTQEAIEANDWMRVIGMDGDFDLPLKETFLTALNLDAWQAVEEVEASVEVARFAVGNGEIVINEESAYLMTDHGMDWYLTPQETLEHVMTYLEENYSQSARSLLTNEEYLFTDYYYDTIASIGNLDEFDGQGPLQYEMVKYAWYKYCYDHDEETIQSLYNEEISGYVFKGDIALEEAKRYFDYDQAATDLEAIDFYNREIEGFEFWYSGPENREGFNNPWGVEYGGMEALGEDRYEIRLITYADSSNSRVGEINVMEVSFTEEGDMKFDRGYIEVPSYELATAAPDLEAVEIGRDYDYMGGRFFGETETAYYFVEDGEEWISYNKLDKESLTMAALAMPAMGEEEYVYRVEQAGQEFFFYTNKQVKILDADWNLMEEVAYPQAIAAGLASYWDHYNDPIYFGESLSEDRSLFAYIDQEGMKLYDVESGTTELIVATEGQGTDAIRCLNPRFVDGDSKILTARTKDYDSGFTIYDLKSKETKTVSDFIMPEPKILAGDRGFFFTDKVNTYFYNYVSGEIKDLPIQGQGPEVYNESFLLVNEKYVAFVEETETGNALTLVDIDTWSVAKTINVNNVTLTLNYLDRKGDVGVKYFFTYENFGDAVLRMN